MKEFSADRLERLLDTVLKPARYTGGEMNAVCKPFSDADVTFAFCFPDSYEVGMSHLGIKILYDIINRRPWALCERVFMPWPDMADGMRRENLPLFSIESRTPLRQFDIVGFTLQYEMCYTNILEMLDLADIPVFSKDRTDGPLIIAGGPCAYNPEPLAPFIDAFQIGDGEELMVEFIECVRACKAEGLSRLETLRRLAKLDGVYVPAFYQETYNEDGTLASFTPTDPVAPARVRRRVVLDLDKAAYPESFVVPYTEAVFDRITLEIMRGCTRGCRFCQAGMLYRPVRERSLETLLRQADSLERSTGYEEISLSSLSSGDYTHLTELVCALTERYADKKVSVSLPSMRLDSIVKPSLEEAQKIRKSGLTLAPEAGTQRLRDVINKGVTEDDLVRAVTDAFESGWSTVKLYFMMGLPTETDEDVLGIADLANKVYHVWRNNTPNRSRGVRITVSTSCFVPKSHTPFQWEAQNTREEYLRKVTLLRENLRNKSITYNWHDPETSFLEAALSRGDRRVADVIEQAWRHGAKFDSWSEYFSLQTWLDAFAACGLSPAFYANRIRDKEEILPWQTISDGVKESYLWKERETAYAGQITPDCRVKCSGCGANRLCEGGICHV